MGEGEVAIEMLIERTVKGYSVRTTMLRVGENGAAPCIAGSIEHLAATTEELSAIVRGMFER